MESNYKQTNLIQYYFYIVIFFLCCLATQRYFLPNAYCEVVNVLLFVSIIFFVKGNTNISIQLLILCALVYADDGGGEYTETNRITGYILKFFCLYIILFRWTRNKPIDKIFIIIFCVLILTSGIQIAMGQYIDSFTFFRDLFFAIICYLTLFELKSIKTDINLIFVGGLGFLMGELGNSFYFIYSFGSYLSFTSLKCLALLPLLLLNPKQLFKPFGISLTLITFYVILCMNSRSLFLTAHVVYIIKCSSFKWRQIKIIELVSIFCTLILILASSNTSNIERLKTYQLIYNTLTSEGATNLLEIFFAQDSTRYAEHVLFFSRSFFDILFGNGFGSIIEDKNLALINVSYEATAFSRQELLNNRYWNFHDYHIDFGFRFGLVPTLLLPCYLLWKYYKYRRINYLICLVLLLNSSWTTIGILVFGLISKIEFKNDKNSK